MVQFARFHSFASWLVLLVGCAETPPPDGPGSDASIPSEGEAGAGAEAGGCIVDGLPAQPRQRFPVGRTFYLPRLDSTAADCAGEAWALASAPAENLNAVVQGADGFARFTPHAVGTYSFQTPAGLTESVTVVEVSSLAFANYNYAPSRSLSMVGEELWAADILTASVARLSPADLQPLGRVAVGGWPAALAHQPGMADVLVAQRGDDTVGFIDVESGRLVDAVWVGDEPASLALSADGATAYVTLATESQVAVIDVAARAVVGRYDGPRDPYALERIGERLVVAGRRTGKSDQTPFESFDPAAEVDIVVLDARTGERQLNLLEVGTSIADLLAAPDGSGFYFARVRNPGTDAPDQSAGLAWNHELAFFDFATQEITRSADLGRQPSSAGYAVTLHSMAIAGEHLFVSAESSDLVLRLDAQTLEEQGRTEVEGRPRHVLAGADGSIFVHGPQRLLVTKLGPEGTLQATGSTGEDPRDPELALGQYNFTGTGDTFGENHGCNSCHADGLSDGVVWNVGTGEEFNIPRPFFWLEGTRPLGWGGYMSTARNFGYETQINIGRRPDTAQARSVGRFLSSLLPPPAANGLTRRDGSLSDEALVGKEIFETRGGCTACHAGPVATNGALFDPGVTVLPSDVPSLVGIYRMPGFLKTGEAQTLEQAVARMVEWLGTTTVTEADRAALVRYLQELTARELFVLRGPDFASERLPIDVPLDLYFSLPVYDGSDNLARITLRDAAGNAVPASVQRVAGNGQQVELTPSQALLPASDYVLEVAAGFEGEAEQVLEAPFSLDLRTAAAPTLLLPQDAVWTVAMPGIDPDDGTFTEEKRDVTFALRASPAASGAKLTVDYAGDLTYDLYAIVEGSTLHLPALPVAAGPAFVDGTPAPVELLDDDQDGVADRAEGRIVLRGPGLYSDTESTLEAGVLEPPEPPDPPSGTGEGVLGDSCEADAQCGPEAPYCAIQPGQALGFCTTTGCSNDADCEPGWTCFDLSVFVPGADPFCNAP